MAFNKTKAIQDAQVLVGQGKLKEAAAALQKVYSKDPKDQNVLNALGDLYVRQNNMAEALPYYIQLADQYASEGFLVRGIAMYKKITKLDAGNVHAIERLADLYTMQGMLADARSQYLQLAEAHVKSGQAPKAMEVLQKVLDLDPDNIKIQRRLAELYERHGQPLQAAQVYRRLAERFLSEGKTEEGNQWMQKATALAPGDASVLLLQARQLQEAGQAGEALAALEKISNLDENPEAVELLIRALLEAGRTEDAERKAEELFSADNNKFSGFMQLALHAAREKNAEKAVGYLERVLEPALASDPYSLADVVREAASQLPDSEAVLALFARVARSAQNQTALAEALGRQAHAAERRQDYAAAKEFYNELVGLDPQNPEFTRGLNRVRAELGEVEAAPEPELASASSIELAPEVELDEETQAFVDSTTNDIDLFSSYGMSEKAIELAEALVNRVPSHIDGNEKLLDLYIGTGNDTAVVEVATRLELLHRRAGNTPRAQELADIARGYAEKAGIAIPGEAAAAAPAPEAETAQEFAVPAAEEEPAAAADAGTFEIPVEPIAQEEAPAEAAPAEAALHEVDLSAEWDQAAGQAEAPTFNAEEATQEVAFYLDQGLTDQARKILERYEQQFPGEAALEELRARVEGAPAVEEAAAEPAAAEEEVAPEPVETSAGDGETYDIVLEEQPAAAAPSDGGGAMSAQDFFSDLAGEMDQALEATGAPEQPAKAAAPPLPPPPAPVAEEAPAEEEMPTGVLAEVFEAFKEEMGGVEEVEDTESHYNLGIAYKEMGLLDEAISEFQKVSKAAEKTRGYNQLFQACTLLGLCFMDKGLPQIAVRWYERALKTPGVDEEGALALRYDMGIAHEQAGDRKSALGCFMEVYGVNVDYRDVSDRIRELQGA